MPLLTSLGIANALGFGLVSGGVKKKGFGSLVSPSTSILNGLYALDFSKNGSYIATCNATSPFIHAYTWISYTGFGTKFADPSSLPSQGGYEIAFNRDSNAVGMGGGVAGTVYSWSSSGFGTKFANPSTLPLYSSTGRLAFSPDPNQQVICLGSNTAGFSITSYAWSSSGFGTKFADPTSYPSGSITRVEFNAIGTALCCMGISGASRVVIYPFIWYSGYGTKYADPATPLSSGAYGVTFNTANTVVGFADSTSTGPAMYAWSDSSGFGTKFSASSNPINSSTNLSFNKLGSVLGVANQYGASSGQPIVAYSWTPTGFGTKFADATTQKFVYGQDISINPVDNAMAFCTTTASSYPFIFAYNFNV